jgi:exonuclease VII small subunit
VEPLRSPKQYQEARELLRMCRAALLKTKEGSPIVEILEEQVTALKQKTEAFERWMTVPGR